MGLVNKNTVLFWQIDALPDPSTHEGFYGRVGSSAGLHKPPFHGNMPTTQNQGDPT
jgi:hypothetical protein